MGASVESGFSQELKSRGISGVEDPTFDRLARFGAIASDSEVSSFKNISAQSEPGELDSALKQDWTRHSV